MAWPACFPALNVAAGQVSDACSPRRRHQESGTFLHQAARAYPGTGLHVICGSHAAHQHPDVRARLARPQNQRLTPHVTPASCSRPNLAGCLFSITTRPAIGRGSSARPAS
jgi:hypothetical protein